MGEAGWMRESGERLWGMPASASLSALALGEGDVEGEWRHSQETRFHSRETRTLPAAPPHSLAGNECKGRWVLSAVPVSAVA